MQGEDEPVSVQIVGAIRRMMAEAARFNVDHGAQIIDINMGCPAKKVCNVMAGSALMQDEDLVARILDAVVSAVDVPVTLKIRTGWDRDNRNGVAIARVAEQSGIQALAVHGRTRACGFRGEAEYDTIAAIKAAVDHSGDRQWRHHHPGKGASRCCDYTGADGVMIGRAAQGRPWIFREIAHYPADRRAGSRNRTVTEIRAILLGHLHNLYAFYGEYSGVRMARKHISWYSKGLRDGNRVPRSTSTQLESAAAQLDYVAGILRPR